MPRPTTWVGPFGTWGVVVPTDLTRPLPCDRWLPGPDQVLHRGVVSSAPCERLFEWVGQLRAAPYSYDWIDNLGRASPVTLTVGADGLAIGDRINTIFRVVDLEPGRSVTMRFAADWFGEVVCTYLVESWDGGSRLLVRFPVVYAGVLAARAMAWLLPAGDLVMMRRQLLNLAALAAP